MTDFGTWLSSYLSKYPILGGGAALGFAGVLVASLRAWPGRIYGALRKRLFYTLEVTTDDRPFFNWLEQWAQQHVKFSRNFRPTHGEDESAEAEGRFNLTPAVGRHFLVSPFGWGWYSQTREATQSASNGNSYSRTVSIELFSPLRGPMFKQLLLASYEAYRKTLMTERVRIFVPESDYWQNVGWLRKRSLASVVLPDRVQNEMVRDVAAFLQNAEWYQEMGVPYRRGYLFYGPPGNGKTSEAIALAHRFKLSVYSLSLSSPGMSDDRLRNLTSDLPDRCLLLLEDVDAAFAGRDGGAASMLSFSGLLNALDGAATTEGRILVMTTNFPEKLDAALVRPGRVDRQWEFPNADVEMAGRLFERFLPEATEAEYETWLAEYGRGTYSMAQLQELLVQRALPQVLEQVDMTNDAEIVKPVRRRRHRPISRAVG